MRKLVVIAAFGALLGVLPASAFAWSSYSSFDAVSQGFRFAGVELSSPNEGSGRCRVTVTLRFRAPTEESKKDSYTFRVRVSTKGGAVVQQSFTTTTDKHSARFSVDTTQKACWAQTMQRPTGLDVKGCRGQGCSP